jgi:hypothetical protein
MLQNILNLEGAKKLTVDQQKNIKGGTAALAVCYPKCLRPKICVGNKCIDPA